MSCSREEVVQQEVKMTNKKVSKDNKCCPHFVFGIETDSDLL
jgi:hypothetical protein